MNKKLNTFTSFLKRLSNQINNKHWPGASVSPSAIIEGDLKRIFLGNGVIVEAGAVLSTKYGGTITLGDNTVVRRGAMIMTYGGDITLGSHSGVNPYTILYGHGGLKIGNHVWIAAHCVVIPANHTFQSRDLPIYHQPLIKKGITIDDDVWVGAGVMILDGTHVGTGSVIGAGSIITRNIPEQSVAIGNPAKVVQQRLQSEE